jgi:hypothetical protein
VTGRAARLGRPWSARPARTPEHGGRAAPPLATSALRAPADRHAADDEAIIVGPGAPAAHAS